MTSCLEIDVSRKLRLEPQIDIVGRRIAILGVSGQGKSNTAAVLIEELLTNGFPLTIVDLEGEYWGLKEQFQILVVGRGEHVDLVAGPYQAAALAAASIMESIPMILDLSDFAEDEMTSFLLECFGSLWEAAGRQRTPYEVIIEEAHEFIPEGVKNPLKELLTRIALRGRKRGIGSIIMSQRSAKVAKDFLTQAEMLFLHRVIHPVDLKVYKELIPLAPKQVTEMVGKLQTGQVVFVYNNEAQEIQVRPRHTFSAGATPQLEEQVAGNLKTVDHALLEKLAQAIQTGPEQLESKESRRIRELETELKNLRQLMVVPEITVSQCRQSLELPVAPGQRNRVAINDNDRQRLGGFLTRLGQLNDQEKAVTAFLLGHDDVAFTRSELFQAIGLAMSNFNRDFPRLVKVPFVTSRTTLPITVKVRLKDWSKTAFPGVDNEVIKREVMRVLV